MMFGIGLGEILLIIFVTFLISPKDMPKVMRKIGEFFGMLGRVRSDIATIRKEMEDIVRDTDIHNVIKDNKSAGRHPISGTAGSEKPLQDPPADRANSPKAKNHKPPTDRQG